jgi:multimeric flavodoxin WrbA
MNIVAIMASYRKGRTIDTLVDHALAGALEASPGAKADKICLVDKHIEYCRNCMICRDDDPSKPLARCVIQDDMQAIYPMLDTADAFIIGTPINMGRETAILKTFIERCCYVFAKPGNFPMKGVPTPRGRRRKKAVAILSTGTVPPWLRLLCDDATPLIRDFCKTMLNAKLIDSLYAGAIHKRTVDYYLQSAFRLGQELAD